MYGQEEPAARGRGGFYRGEGRGGSRGGPGRGAPRGAFHGNEMGAERGSFGPPRGGRGGFRDSEGAPFRGSARGAERGAMRGGRGSFRGGEQGPYGDAPRAMKRPAPGGGPVVAKVRKLDPASHRFLVSERVVKVIIGKKGENIAKVKEAAKEAGIETKVSIFVQHSDMTDFERGTADRVMAVNTTPEGLAMALEGLVPAMQREPPIEGKKKKLEIRLIIPHAACSAVIGSKGSVVKQLTAQTKSFLQVYTNPLPNCDEAVVRIQNFEIVDLIATITKVQEIVESYKKDAMLRLYDPHVFEQGQYGDTGSYMDSDWYHDQVKNGQRPLPPPRMQERGPERYDVVRYPAPESYPRRELSPRPDPHGRAPRADPYGPPQHEQGSPNDAYRQRPVDPYTDREPAPRASPYAMEGRYAKEDAYRKPDPYAPEHYEPRGPGYAKPDQYRDPYAEKEPAPREGYPVPSRPYDAYDSPRGRPQYEGAAERDGFRGPPPARGFEEVRDVSDPGYDYPPRGGRPPMSAGGRVPRGPPEPLPPRSPAPPASMYEPAPRGPFY